MRTRTKRSHSESRTDCDSESKKRWKKSRSPDTIHDISSDSETFNSSKTETICSPSSSSSTSSSTTLNRPFPNESENRLASPTSSNDGEDGSSSLLFAQYARSGFRRFSKLLDRSNLNRRSLPPQLRTERWGSPQKFWDVLCNKTKVYKKDVDWTKFHPDLSKEMRFILLEWLMEVSDDLSLERESFYLAVDYIDRFFSVHPDVRKSSFQLVGATALFLAAKNEEVEPPRLSVFVDYGDGAYDEDDLRKCELIMLHDLEWQMNPITSLQWLRIYIQLAGCEVLNFEKLRFQKQLKEESFWDDQDSILTTSSFPRLEFLHLAKVLDLCILDYGSLGFESSMLSAAVFSFVFGPDEVIEEVTGYKITKLAKAREFVRPYLAVCNRHRPVGEPIKVRHGIRDEEMHNIQSLHPHLSKLMDEAQKMRQEIISLNYGDGMFNFTSNET